MKRITTVIAAVVALLLTFSSCLSPADLNFNISTPYDNQAAANAAASVQADNIYTIDNHPDYSGNPYVVINGNVPDFSDDQFTTESWEYYGELDQFGRCTACVANIGKDLMPTDDRGSISSVTPSGWVQQKYDCINGKNLYNRCHLIGYQLTAENANHSNLITGTRYLNVDGMLPFEDMVADYIKETGNHVLYRVTPVFENDELVARGVQMEAISVEDHGDGICYNIFCYNVQPGVELNYATGESKLCTSDSLYAIRDGVTGSSVDRSGVVSSADDKTSDYALNTKTRKFHTPDCSSVSSIKNENRENRKCTRASLIDEGYTPCGACKP